MVSYLMDLDEIIQLTQIKAEGEVKAQDITCKYANGYVSFNNEERKYIENEWNNLVKLKPFVFDGNIIHVTSIQIQNLNIVFQICNSTFKDFIGTNNDEFKKIFGENNVIRPLSVGTMILTSDKKWVIGRRSKTHDYEMSYTLVAGYMDPEKDIFASKPDPFFAIRREIIEETGMHSHDINNISCLGLDGENQPYLAFLTKLTISAESFKAMVPGEMEFTEFEFYDLEGKVIKNFLLAHQKETTPHALANMLMFYHLMDL
jgi:8-oxo-dGTP pyrophosphatase MutT (NUDIX family)